MITEERKQLITSTARMVANEHSYNDWCELMNDSHASWQIQCLIELFERVADTELQEKQKEIDGLRNTYNALDKAHLTVSGQVQTLLKEIAELKQAGFDEAFKTVKEIEELRSALGKMTGDWLHYKSLAEAAEKVIEVQSRIYIGANDLADHYKQCVKNYEQLKNKKV